MFQENMYNLLRCKGENNNQIIDKIDVSGRVRLC